MGGDNDPAGEAVAWEPKAEFHAIRLLRLQIPRRERSPGENIDRAGGMDYHRTNSLGKACSRKAAAGASFMRGCG